MTMHRLGGASIQSLRSLRDCHENRTMARPPSPNGPKTVAQRKADQRERDRLAAWGDKPLTEVTAAALLDALAACLTGKYPERTGRLLVELGRRAGVCVTVTPAPPR